mmetsp:Transcript_5855/g.13578  ORF Transcript_5855/g.13578 Transcript_5855/m.13578 type:complete len:634 (+) Transcript_5855:105-2006(+)
MAEEVNRVRSRIVLSSGDATEAQLVPPKHGPYDLRAFLSHDGRLNKETGIDGFPRRGCDLRRAPSFDGFEGHEVDITSAIGLRKTLSLRRKKSSYKSVGEKDDYNSEDEDDLTAASSGVNAFDSDSHDLDKYNRRRRDKRRQFRVIVCGGLALVCAGAVYLTVGNEGNPSIEKRTAKFFDDAGQNVSLPTSHAPGVIRPTSNLTTVDETIDRDSFHLPVENDGFSFDESGDDESNPAVTEKEDSPMEAGVAGDASFPLSPAQVTMGPNAIGATETPTAPAESALAATVDSGFMNFTATEKENNPMEAVDTSLPLPQTQFTKDHPNDAIGATDSTPTAPAESALAATADSGLTSSAGGTLTTFYAIADCPYDDNERQNLMPAYIENLDGDADFMVHLGDLQYAKVDRCREYAYREAAGILGRSAITTFVLPGDNDINDCDDVSHGESMWLEHLHRFDERWDHPFDVRRWGTLDESFTFVHRRVLYFAVNIVGGEPHSRTEKERRHREHLAQIRGTLSEIEDGDFDVMVLLGHAEPSRHHRDFFRGRDGFYSIVAEVGKPTLHLHGDRHEYYEQPGSDELGLDNYIVISLDGESIAPPIRIEIDVSRKSPITVSRVRKGLDVDCCSRGWPPSEEL